MPFVQTHANRVMVFDVSVKVGLHVPTGAMRILDVSHKPVLCPQLHWLEPAHVARTVKHVSDDCESFCDADGGTREDDALDEQTVGVDAGQSARRDQRVVWWDILPSPCALSILVVITGRRHSAIKRIRVEVASFVHPFVCQSLKD